MKWRPDQQLGRLVGAFEERAAGPRAIMVVGDHGEGLGDHGESQHGNLVYQATMHVPLLLVGPGLTPGVSDSPVSTRRVFHTVLDWAGLGAADSLRGAGQEVVLGEAMKPFLSYGWQPQVMAVEGRTKAIFAGRLEVYDVVADPAETRDLAAGVDLSRPARTALRDYPVPSLEAQRPPDSLGEEERRKLASLGYVSAGASPVARKDAPRPVDMRRLFDLLDTASTLFVEEKYAKVIPLLEKILAEDPHNLDAALRLATAHSMLGHEGEALASFTKAGDIVPGSQDVRTYLALHYLRGRQWQRAAPLLEQVVAEAPDRLPALEGLAQVRDRQGRVEEALALRQKVYGMRAPTAAELVRLGEMAMSGGEDPSRHRGVREGAGPAGRRLRARSRARRPLPRARRFAEARDALDRVPPSHPEYPMALFKRAQVSVLLHEPDQAARIERARARADATTRELIARERLFRQTP